MKKKLVALSVLSLLLGTSNVSAQDDVLVDLSVLQNMQGNSYEGLSSVNVPQPSVQTTIVETVSVADGTGKSVSTLLNLPPLEPKFPIVKAKPKQKQKAVVQKQKPVKKKAEKKIENPFTEGEIVECQKYLAEKDVQSVAKTPLPVVEKSVSTPEASQDVVEAANASDVDRIIKEYEESKKLETEVAPVKLEENLALQEENISESNEVSLETTPVSAEVLAEPENENVNLAPVSDNVLAEPEKTNVEIAPISEEALSEPEKAEVPTSVDEEIAQALEAPVSEEGQGLEKAVEVVPTEEVKSEKTPEVVTDEALSGPQNLINVKSAEVSSAVDLAKEKVDAEVSGVKEEVKALVPVENPLPTSETVSASVEDVVPAYASDLIEFSEGVTSLTEVDKVKINSILTRFEDAKANKIGIIAYNLDNGQDSFKRKRECLSRATEIRSYLLSKGYKEFKIKVINVDETSGKVNAVELTELK